MIKDKLVYNDIYKTVDASMSDFQIGARKQKNIRNHLFVVYSIINAVIQKKDPPIDIQLYDVKQAFDSLDLEECCNDLYDAGIQDEKLTMIYEGSRINNVAISTPVGESDRTYINDIVTQGGTLGGMMCSLQIDDIGKDALVRDEYMYYYQDKVGIGHLDEVMGIAKCGAKSVATNAYINSKFEAKKLTLNETKCKKIHVGKLNSDVCPDLNAHEETIETVLHEKYIGDVIATDGKNNKKY